MPQIPEQALIAFWTIIMSSVACIFSFLIAVVLVLILFFLVDKFIIQPEARRIGLANDDNR